MTETTFSIPSETQNNLSLRLRRIEGQIRGIQRMVEEGNDCRKIVNQVMAVKAALSSLNVALLECYARDCMGTEGATPCEGNPVRPEREKTVEELIAMMQEREQRDKTLEELITILLKATR